MEKNFLTVFWYDDMSKIHLYKDVGGIPYALAKYCGWNSNFAYNDINGIIHSKNYEKYVKLHQITFIKLFVNLNSRYLKFLQILKYVYLNAHKYDIINFYHCSRATNILCMVAKIRNPNIITYVKMDMGKENFRINLERQTCIGGVMGWCEPDLFTVETKAYVEPLNKLKHFKGKVKYLSNGFFSDLVEIDKNIKKEKIILTVGRLGTRQKNTEMLIEAIEKLDPKKLKEWKIYLVGSMTDGFKEWFERKLNMKPYLKNYFIITGNINDKKELYTLYARSSVFVLPSRWEGFPLVLPEALSFSCYPITTNSFDAVFDIIKSEFGKIVPNEDKNALKVAIDEVLDGKIDYISNGKKAQKYVNENFDWKVIASNLDSYFKEIYENRLRSKKC